MKAVVKIVGVGSGLLLLGSCQLCFAGSAQSQFQVSANVISTCSIQTPSALAFGDYDPQSSNDLAAQTQVSIQCTKGVEPSIGLSAGNHAEGSVRRMGGTGNALLEYQLYKPAANTPGASCLSTGGTVWGNSGDALFKPQPSTGIATRTYNICGRITHGQDVTAGNGYSDTILATVNF